MQGQWRKVDCSRQAYIIVCFEGLTYGRTCTHVSDNSMKLQAEFIVMEN